MSTKDQDDYDAFCQLQPAPRWQAFKAERDRADKAEAELKIHQHWHEEAIKLQGPEPGRTPSMVNAWIRNLMSRLDSSKARADAAEKRIAEDSMCHGCKSKDVASRCSSCGKEW